MATADTAISVVVRARNKAEGLALLLADLESQDCQHSWEVLVVDDDRHDPASGLNRVLEDARGELVVFVDDDVRLTTRWLAGLYGASQHRPTASVLCGPIVPAFPPCSPAWVGRGLFASLAFPLCTRTTEACVDCSLPPPWLANVAVRASALRRKPAVSDDGDWLAWIVDGLQPLCVPAATVTQRIGTAWLRPANQFEWAFNFGRRTIIMNRRLHLLQMPRLLEEPGHTPLDYFDAAVLLNFYYGQLHQLSQHPIRADSRILFDLICVVRWSGTRAQLAASAQRWLVESQHYIPPAARRTFFAM